MAKTTKPLTNTEVSQAKPKDKEYNLLDGHGLMLRVKPTGTKSWLFNYYHPVTKKRKNLSLGQYPAFSLADARKQRTLSKELLAKDIDPIESRNDKKTVEQFKASNTLLIVASNWFEIKQTKIAETTSISLWRSLNNHILPSLGHRPIDRITAPEAIKILEVLAAKGSLELTSKIIGYLNEIMIHAVNTGLLLHNPLAGIRAAFKTPTATNMPSLSPGELPELMQVLANASIKITTRCLIEWQLHTMVRPSEAAGITWSEIDIANKLWLIPAARMKMKRAHIVPLSDACLRLLEVMKPISGHREYVFTADRYPNKPANAASANMALKRMGFKGRLVAHGLRSLASTTLNEQGFDADVIEASLAHVDSNEVRRAYNRSEYIERRRVLMNWWSEHIVSAATGNMSLSGRSHKGLSIVNG
ncbi:MULTISPECIES: integrase domain-containing protein [unclassified Colwellia]|uniref:integrase domain-containing protein n=1 Tax=unclassified Colwellia TaxID=196834 RepID=UPI0015F7044C|nr:MULTISPECIES: integrase domain-containing protein [unclassified Colwellia]MBA6234069.1 tyrosine-type recombinase/integrase [Colwellia sp. MB02u-7]MBA6238009.1 tyrosine-type recombinase/integrase [Colwellia sp. MB02u-11]MBA6300743.1 tyrosine-type recombinase/integrase [Colwellia sp. MB3u-22]MBA6311358.1 tyrosine-type recombinase/integrase [Colwellia sp. MB3u-64]